MAQCLLFFAVLWGPLAFGAVESLPRSLLEINLLLLFLLCHVRWRRSNSSPQINPLAWGFLGLTILGILQSVNPRDVSLPAILIPFSADRSQTIYSLPLWATYAALSWCAPMVLSSAASRRKFAWSLFVVGAIVSIIGIAQLGQGNAAYYGLRRVVRGIPFGPYVNRDHAASLMVMSAFAGLGLLLSGVRAKGSHFGAGAAAEIISRFAIQLFLLLIILRGIWLTQSRGAFDSFWVAVIFVSFLASLGAKDARAQLRLRVWSLFLGISAAAFFYCHPRYWGYLNSSPDIGTIYRLSMYKSSIRLMLDFPLWGVGIGAVQTAFVQYKELIISGIVDHVHSDPLELLLQSGLICGMSLIILTVHRMVLAWQAINSKKEKYLTMAIFAATVAFIFQASLDFTFEIPANCVIFLTLLGFLHASSLDLSNQAMDTF